MKEDIKSPKVEDVAVAIVKEENEEGAAGWMVYFINMREYDLETVLVRSNGYGEHEGEKIKTSELRHSLDKVKAESAVKVETIVEDVFGITNQYWISFFHDARMYDKKYVFVPGSIDEKNLIKVPIVEKMGVMIK